MQAVLQRELENMWDFMQQDESIRLPINPSMEITGVDAKVKVVPIKLSFINLSFVVGRKIRFSTIHEYDCS